MHLNEFGLSILAPRAETRAIGLAGVDVLQPDLKRLERMGVERPHRRVPPPDKELLESLTLSVLVLAEPLVPEPRHILHHALLPARQPGPAVEA